MSTVNIGSPALLKRDTFTVDGIELAWVPGEEGKLAVSKTGQVWRGNTKTLKNRWAKQTKSTLGYYTTHYEGKNIKVHILIAKTWVYNPDKEKRIFVDHMDRNRTNNNCSNLRWSTMQENAMNAEYNGIKTGEGKWCPTNREAKEEVAKYKHEWYENHKEEAKQRAKDWYEEHKEEINKKRRKKEK